MATLTSCPVCGYPVKAHFEGETAVCANCGEQMQAVVETAPVYYPEGWTRGKEGLPISQGITISTPLLVGVLAFAAGMFLGPALMASTQSGQSWLLRQAKRG